MNKVNQFARSDGFNPSVDYSDPIMKKYSHLEYVEKTGEGEHDFVVLEKPVLVDEINIQKSIDEEAKTTDLKYLLKQLLLSGDESIINKRPGFFGDVTQIQRAIQDGTPIESPEVLKEAIKDSLPVELQNLSVEALASMSDKDLIGFVNKVREEIAKSKAEDNTQKKEGEK